MTISDSPAQHVQVAGCCRMQLPHGLFLFGSRSGQVWTKYQEKFLSGLILPGFLSY